MPRTIPKLADQLFAFNPDTDTILAVQRWSGFLAGRDAYVQATNDKVTTQRAGHPDQVRDMFRRVSAQLAGQSVTEMQARDRLVQMGLPRQRQCAECDAKLPLGGLYCTVCGLNQTLPASIQPRAAAPHRR